MKAAALAAEENLKRLYPAVEKGITDLDDILEDRLAPLKVEGDRSKGAPDRMLVSTPSASTIVTELFEEFGRLTRTHITAGHFPFREAWLQAIVE